MGHGHKSPSSKFQVMQSTAGKLSSINTCAKECFEKCSIEEKNKTVEFKQLLEYPVL